MSKRRKKPKLKQAYQNLQELHDEACDYITELTEDMERTSKDLHYLYEFICYKQLEDEFRYFRKYAHEVQDPDSPFPDLVL